MKQVSAFLVAALCALAVTRTAHAGGYDTPILYSARHMGMAGTAVAYVYDASALFHNPAGLANVKRASVIGDFSPLLGKIQGNPLGPSSPPQRKTSDTTFAPFFLVGGAYRFTDWLTAGFAVYPVASAGAEYKYTFLGSTVENRTKLMFVEASPGLAFNLPAGFNLGVSYRVTYVKLDRYQGNPDAPKTATNPLLNFQMSGTNWAGFRVGAQWHHEFGPHQLKLGAHYRHKTVTEITNDKGRAISEFKDISTKFALPSRFSFGSRYDIYDFGVAFDLEYALNSQNKEYALEGTNVSDGSMAKVYNIYKWTNAFTLRQGIEYRLLDSHLPLRAGYAWDQKTANPKYPSAFGTPPGNGHIITFGGGWNAGKWQANAAYAYRTVEGKVAAMPDPSCAFCGGPSPSPYTLKMHGIYVDFSYEWQ